VSRATGTAAASSSPVPLKRAADRGEARPDVSPLVAARPTDLFRHQIYVTRVPPADGLIRQIVDEVFLPLVTPRPG
jgi:hypothetical protein